MTHYTFLKASPRIEHRELKALRFIVAMGADMLPGVDHSIA
jgi:hypothetical protein